MMEKQIMELNKRYARKKLMQRIVALLCVFVMLFTVNSLKMVAQTLTRKPMCGLKEHQHKAKCYDSAGNLICGKVEHQHTDACYQESPTLEIEDDSAIGINDDLALDAGGLSLDLDAGALDLNDDLVTEDVAAPVANEAPVTPTYVLGSKALLSNIIESTGLNIKIKKIKEVGIVDNDGSQVGLVEITKKDNGDYRIKALRDFDQVELAIVLADEVVVVKLLDGVAPAEPVVEEPAAPAVEEAQPAPAVEVEQPEQPAPADESEQPELTVPETEDEQIELAEQPEPAVVEEQADLNVEDAQVEQPEVPAAEEMQIEEPAVEDAQVETPVMEAVEPEQPEAPAVVEEVEPEQPEAPAQEEEAEPTEAPAEEEAAEPEPTEAPVVEEATEPEQIATPVTEEEPTEVATIEEEPTEVPAGEEPVEASVDEEAVPQQTEASALVGEIEAPVVEEAAAPELADADLTVDVPADEAEATEPAEPEQTVSVEEPEVQIEETATEEIATEETATEETATEEIAPIEEAVEPAPADAQAEQGDAAEEEVAEPATAEAQAEQEDATEEPAPAEEQAEQGDATGEEAVEVAPADAQTPQEDGEEAAEIEGEKAAQEEIDQLPVAADAETVDGEAGEPEQDEAAVYTAGSREISVNDAVVTLTWPAEAKIPEDVVITIEEIEKGTEDYDLLYHQALAELPEPDQAVTQVMRFFDITLYTADGQKIEPKAPVSVVVSVNETIDSEVSALHCEEVGAPMQTVDANAEGESVAFDAPSFSVYGVNYQVPAEQENVSSQVQVDLSRVDTMGAATVDGMSVSLSVADLLAGTDDAVESTVDSTVDAEQFVAEATVSSPDVIVENGTITLPADALEKATVQLSVETKETDSDYITTVTTHTVDIVLSDYAGRTGETVGEGVTVKAVGENSLPADAKASVEENVEVPQTVEVKEGEAATAFDINLTNANGDAITGPVAVTVMPSELNVLSEVPEGAVAKNVVYTLIHVHNDGTVENVELPADAVVVDENGKVESFSFETESFSTYVLKYTVDFEYTDSEGNVHTWSFPGTGSHKLSVVLKALGIEAEEITAADLVRTETVVEYGEKDLYLTQADGEWFINSDAAFDDTYKLTVVADGETYVITVTDDPSGTGNLAELATIIAEVKTSSNSSVEGTTITVNDTLNITLDFTMKNDATAKLYETWEYDLSSMCGDNSPFTGIYGSNGNLSNGTDILGTYVIDATNNKIIITPHPDAIADLSDISGRILINATVNTATNTTNNTTEIQFPGATSSTTIHVQGKAVNSSKYVGESSSAINKQGTTSDPAVVNVVDLGDGRYKLYYRIEFNTTTKPTSLTLTDTLQGGQELIPESLQIGYLNNTVWYVDLTETSSVTTSADGFSIDMHELFDGQHQNYNWSTLAAKTWYVVTYETILDSNDYTVDQNGRTLNFNRQDNAVTFTYDNDNSLTITKETHVKPEFKRNISIYKKAYTDKHEKNEATDGQPVTVQETDGNGNYRVWFRARAEVNSPTTVLKLTDTYSGVTLEENSLEIQIDGGDWVKVPAQYVAFNNENFVVDVYAYMTANAATLGDYLTTINNQTAIKANTKVKLRYSGLVSENSLGNPIQNTAAWDWDYRDEEQEIEVTPTKGLSYYGVSKSAIRNNNGGSISDSDTVTPGTEVRFSLTVLHKYQNGEYINLAGETVTDSIYDFITGTPTEIWIYDSKGDTVAVLTDYSHTGTYSVHSTTGYDHDSAWSATANTNYNWSANKDITQQQDLFTLTFPSTGNYADAYTICYNVTVDTDDPSSPYYGTKDAYNRVIFGGQSAQKKIVIDYGHTPDIQKEFVSWDEENNTATWTVHVDVPEGGILTETRIQDYYKSGGTHPSSLGDLLSVISMDVTTSGVTKISDAAGASINQYTFSCGDFDNNGATDGIITFPAGLNKDIDITVVTALPSGRDLKTLEDYYAWNKVDLYVDSFYDYDEARADHHTFNNDYTITKDGTFKYDYGTVDGVYGEYPIVEWKVVLNPDQVKLSEDFVPYFFDQLPGGMRPFGNMSISIESYNSARNEVATNTYGNPVDQNTVGVVTYTPDSNATTIGPINLVDVIKAGKDETKCPTGISGIKYNITYKTTLTDAKMAEVLSSYRNHDFTNHVEVKKTENGAADKTASDTVTFQYKGLITKIDKSEEHTQLLDYEVDINKDALTINNGNWLKMSDNINTDVTIVLNTVKVYEVTKDASGKESMTDITKAEPAQCFISYSDDTRRLDVQVPDGKFIRVRFSVIPNAGSQQHSYVNTVKLSGMDFSQHSEVTKNHIADSTGFLTGTSNAVNIKKIDKYNVTKMLPGAKFEFYKCTVDRATGEITGISKVKQGVTNNRGQLSFAPVEADTLYYWVETQAPENYSIATSVPHYFVAYQELTDTSLVTVRFGSLPTETRTALRNAFPEDPIMLSATDDTRIFIKARKPRNETEANTYTNLHYFYLDGDNNPWNRDLVSEVNNANQREAWALDDLVTGFYNGSKIIASIKNGYTWQVDNIPDSVATAELEVTKTMVGRGMSDGEFTFYLYDITDDHDEHWLQTKTNSAGDADVPQTITFDSLSFAVPGTYKYRVYEKQGVDSDVNYDDAVYEAVITVTRDENQSSPNYGKLVASEPVITKKASASAATGESADSMSFINEYNRPGAIVLPGTKTLIGRDMTAREFNFKVTETRTVDDGEGGTTTQDVVVATGTNRAAFEGTPGSIVFTPITYTTSDAGTHTYTVTEDTTTLPANVQQTGTASFTVVVNVTVNNGVVTPTIASTSEPVAFTNKYVVVNATKKWINQTGEEFWPANVTFKLVKKDGNTYSAVSKPSYYENDGSWSDEITVTEANPTATWENLDPLPDGQDYFAVEYEIVGVSEENITRDSSIQRGEGLSKAPATSFTMGGVTYDVTGGTSTSSTSTIINAARTSLNYSKSWENIADTTGLSIKVQIRRYDKETGEEDTTFALRGHEFLLDGAADANAATLTGQESTYGSHTYSYSYTFQEGENWTATWTGLPLSGWLANGDAQEYRYVVSEVGVYRQSEDVSDEFIAVEGIDERSTTNYYKNQDVPFSKVWSPSEPTGAWSITAKLQVSEKLISVEGEAQEGTWSDYSDYEPETTITIGKDASGNLLDGVALVDGKYTKIVNGLPKYRYDEYNGRLYELRFSAAEVEYRGYNTTVKTDDTTGAVTITNTQANSMDVTVNKEWVLASGSATGNKVIVVLKNSSGNPVKTNAAGEALDNVASDGKVELNSGNDFTFTWEDVSVDEYTIQEVQVLNSSGTDITGKYSVAINGTATSEAPVMPDGAVNGIANIVNTEMDEDKTQVTVHKQWAASDGTTVTGTETATVKLVEYRTPKVGTTIHFVDKSGSGISINDLVVGLGNVKITTSNSCGISVSTRGDAQDWQTQAGQDGYIEGNPWDSYTSLEFTVASESDIYVYFWSNPGTVSVPTYTPANAEETTGPFDTGKTLTLTAPSYTGTFYNLATTKEIGGTTYNISYAVEETAPESGYTVEYSTDGSNWTATCGTVGGVGTKNLYVKNTEAAGSLKLMKHVIKNGTNDTNGYTYFFKLYQLNDQGQPTQDPQYYIRLWVTGNQVDDYRVYTKDAYNTAVQNNNLTPEQTDDTTVNGVYFNHGSHYDGYAVIHNLPEGDYLLTEDPTSEPSAAIIVRGDGATDGVVDAANRSVKLHVTAGVDNPDTGTAAVATFTNSYDITQVTVHKVWVDDQGDLTGTPTCNDTGADAKFELQKKNGNSWVKVTNYANGTSIASDDNPKTIHVGDNNWTYTWNNLPKYDGQNLIEYRVVENGFYYGTNSRADYDVKESNGVYTVTKRNAGVTQEWVVTMEKNSQTNTFTYTNTKTGVLKLKKLVTVGSDATTTTLADGLYTFKIHRSSDGATTTNDKTVVITITNGVAASATLDGNTVSLTDGCVVVGDLIPGDYVITENEVSGMTVSSITGGKNGTANTTNRSVTVTVEPGQTVPADQASATFTNDKENKGSLEIRKALLTGSEAFGANQEFKFIVWLGKLTHDDAHGDSVDWDGFDQESVLVNDEETEVGISGSYRYVRVTITGAGTATISNLPAGTIYLVVEETTEGWKLSSVVDDDTQTFYDIYIEGNAGSSTDGKGIIAASAIDHVTVTNYKLGALKLKKLVKVDGRELTVDNSDPVRGRTYHFTVVGPAGDAPITRYVLAEAHGGEDEVATVFKYYASTTDHGYSAVDWYSAVDPNKTTGDGPELTLGNLEPGQYTITEDWNDDIDDDMITTVSDGTTSSTARTITVNVTASETPSVEVTYTNDYVVGNLSLRKVATASTMNPINGDNAKAAGTYKFTLVGPVDGSNQPVAGAITKYVRIYASYNSTRKKLVYSYEMKDEDAGWNREAADPLVDNGGVYIDRLKTGDYLITETGWELDTNTDGTVMHLDSISVSPEDDRVLVALNTDDKTLKVHVDGVDENEIKAVFTNELVPNTMTHRKMVLDVNDSSDTDPFHSSTEQTWEDSADYDIGDHIPYRVTGFLPQAAYRASESYYYRIDDVMQNLEYVDGTGHMFAFVKGPTDVEGHWYQVDEYFTFTGSTTKPDSMETTGAIDKDGTDSIRYLQAVTKETAGLKAIKQGYLTTWGEADTHKNDQKAEPTVANSTTSIDPNHIQYLQLRYKAKLMNTANIGATGNANDAKVYYGNSDSPQSTDWDRNRVFTYKILIKKTYEKDDATRTESATFALYKRYITHSPVAHSVGIGNLSGTTLYAENAANLPTVTAPATKVYPNDKMENPGDYYFVGATDVDDDDKTFEWTGLDDGYYILVELSAPEGYIQMSVPIQFAIVAAHDQEADNPTLHLDGGTYVNVWPDSMISSFRSNTVTTVFNGGAITGNITNEPYLIDIKIEKVVAGSSTALNGAVFKLSKYLGMNGETENWQAVSGVKTSNTDEKGDPVVTGSDGQFTINGNITLKELKDGRYKLEEVSAPEGYIITSKTPVTFTILHGEVVLGSNVLTTGVTYTAKRDAVEAQGGEPAQEATPDTFTIPNTPGAALPATGGPGTTLFYVAGAAMVLLALALLLRRKRNYD